MNDDQKLNDLQAQIDALKAKTQPKPEVVTQESENMSVGMRAGAELVGCIGGAALIGYGLDRWLDTKPWALIIMLLLGVATAFMNIWKATQNMGSAVGFKKPMDDPK
jgi:ATP synthase protein I